MAEKKTSSAIEDSGRSTARGTLGLYRILKSVGTKKVIIIGSVFFFLLLFSSLPALTSQSQMGDTFHVTAQGDEAGRPKDEEIKESLWDKEKAAEDTVNLLAVISTFKEEDRNKRIAEIEEICIENGWDVGESLSRLVEDYETVNLSVSTQSSGNVIQNFSIDSLTDKEKKTVTYKAAEPGGATADIYGSEKVSAQGGVYTYINEGNTDYLVRMGSFFGSIGNRYKITYKDGSSITVLKAEEFPLAGTTGGEGITLSGGGVIEILHPEGVSSGAASLSRNLSRKEVKKVEMLESEFCNSTSTQLTGTDGRVLAAFSVSLHNSQLIKGEGPFKKGFLKFVGDQYISQRGDIFNVNWFGQHAGEIDFEKTLKSKLKSFLKKDSFYKIDFERTSGGSIKVYSYIYYVSVENQETGEMEEVPVEVKYVIPHLIELDINSLAEKIFDVDPAASYVNSGSLYDGDEGSITNKNTITNREAINALAQGTNAFLFNIYFSGGEINISELSGQYAWPVPTCKVITSPYGSRIHPVLQTVSFHEGIDIGCGMGSNVYAAEKGTVEFAGYSGNYGIKVVIAHENGMKTIYAHLSMAGVSKGSIVEKGQLIAHSGNTGRSTGPHLHFEIRNASGTVNPIGYVTTAETINELIFS